MDRKAVSRLIVGEGEKHPVRIVIGSVGELAGKAGAVVTVDGHPFWVVGLHRWVKTSEVPPGMLLRTSAGTHVQITTTEKWTAHHRVHNLTVDDLHTCHVPAGDQAVLVHDDGPGDDLSFRDKRWQEQGANVNSPHG